MIDVSIERASPGCEEPQRDGDPDRGCLGKLCRGDGAGRRRIVRTGRMIIRVIVGLNKSCQRFGKGKGRKRKPTEETLSLLTRLVISRPLC